MVRYNNFDSLRLVFALFVIITHSYPLAGLKECGDFLCLVTQEQLSFSYIGLVGFFTLSGYLIFQSFERSKSLPHFYWKRILRIFPGLIAVLVLTVLLAPFVYDNKDLAFLSNRSVWTYIPNNLTLYNTQHLIDGVFKDNPFNKSINGSLWTIPYEFTLYVALSFFFVFREKKTLIRVLLLTAFLLLVIGNSFFIERIGRYEYYLKLKFLFDFGGYFVAGALLASFKIENFTNKTSLLLFSVLALVILQAYVSYYALKIILFPVILILLGLRSTPIINSISNKIGDLSYGIYIYGFVIQQTLQYYFRLNYIDLMLASIGISIILAYISWHLIEKRALKLKTLKAWKDHR